MPESGSSSAHPPLPISAIIPVLNAQDSLEGLVTRLEATLSAIAPAHEIILVNDGSTDESWSIIARLARSHSFVRGIDLMRNYGQHNALLAGIRAASHSIIVTLDDDLQNPPEEIPKLVERLDDGFDVVYGSPSQEQHGFLRDLASIVTKLALQSAIGAQTARKVNAFRALRTQLRDAFSTYRSPYVSIDVLLTWATTRFSSVSVRHEPRKAGQSNYTFMKLVTHAMNMMTGFSTVPLQVASVTGFTFTLFGVLTLCFVLGRYMVYGAVVPGFAFLASVVSIFSGAQLFALGIIGEYLARMHFRAMEKPPYAIRDMVAREESPR